GSIRVQAVDSTGDLIMNRIWKMSRGRVFSSGSKTFTKIARVQSIIPSKLEQNAGVNGSVLLENSLGARALSFCRPFSGGTETVSLNFETPQSKSSPLLADCKKKADFEKYLSGFCTETTLSLVHQAMEVMHSSDAKCLFSAAATTQEVAKFSRFLYNMLFRTFLQARRFNDAVEVLEEMKKTGIPVNLKSFSTLAFFYAKAGMKVEAEATLDTMKSFGITKTLDIYRVLFNEYIAAGDEESIERLLQKCSEPEGLLDAPLDVFAELGKAEEVLKLLNRMDAAGIAPRKTTSRRVVKCLCSANMLDEAMNHVMKLQEKGGLDVFNALIGSLVGEKRLDDALKLVANMKSIGCKPDISTHHHLISGYLNTGQTDKALAQLEEMKLDGCKPTSGTKKLFEGTLDKTRIYTKALDEGEDAAEGTHVKAANRILELCEGKLWNADIEEALSGFSKDLTDKVVKKVLQKMEVANLKDFFTWAGKQKGYSHGRHEYRALIRRFLDAGMFDISMECLEEMWQKDVKVLPNDFAAVVYYSGKAGRMTEAKEVMDKMRFFGLNPDANLYAAALSGHIKANDDEGVARVLQNLSDVGEFNGAIAAFARAGKADSALKLLQVMEEKGCHANVRTYDWLVKCLCSAERTEEALEALENMQAAGLDPNVNIYNALISHCCRHKKLDEALKLFSQMKEKGCQPDIVTHNSLISGYLKSRQVDRAHQHMELMKAEGCMPTRETSRLFVINLSMSEELDKALKEFEKAAECGNNLSIDACNCLLKGLIKAGKMDVALNVYNSAKGVADTSTYVVMLRGCCNLAKFDVIEQLLAEVRARELQLPVSTYVLLLQTYSRAKINKKVSLVFEELQKSGLCLDGPRTNTALLDALSRGCQLDTGVKFCKHLADISAKINSRQLKHFFRLLVRSGRAGEATELSKELSERGCVIPEKSEAPPIVSSETLIAGIEMWTNPGISTSL
ncbi:hypothetical protein GOP47_0004915, partial [Adiantum capillus-veneris]